ncbi:hypothetical protein MUO98_00405, partial [Candidatus Bathyarchaeota archaeon]|nr:hypothetical protein [Candidatus Bathyarchaeota archaeon]
DNEVKEFVGEAIASAIISPSVAWAQFILTDDQPNGNRQRVPLVEFDNIIETGLHMPIKMAEGQVSEGHDDTKPIGTISFLKKELTEAGNRIVALAALWSKERPDDVELLKELMDTEDGVNVSWELSFGDVEAGEGGSIDFRDVALNAVTIVARPAYQGRTRFLALAAKARDWSKPFIDDLPDASFLYIERGGELDSDGKTSPRELRHFPIKDSNGLIIGDRLATAMEQTAETSLPANILRGVRKTIKSLKAEMDEGVSLEVLSFGEGNHLENTSVEDTKLETLEEIKLQLKLAENALAVANASLDEKELALKTMSESLVELGGVKESLESEAVELREFKSEVVAEAANLEKFESIKAKFVEAGVEKTAEYFEENKEYLLKLEDADLAFMIQEFSNFTKEAEASVLSGKIRVPNITGATGGTAFTPSELAKALRERKAK